MLRCDNNLNYQVNNNISSSKRLLVDDFLFTYIIVITLIIETVLNDFAFFQICGVYSLINYDIF